MMDPEGLPPDLRQLMANLEKAARFPAPFEWLYQRKVAYDEMLVQHHALAKRVGLRQAVRYLAAIAGMVVLIAPTPPIWLMLIGTLLVGALASNGAGAPLERARAYRSGWADRGRADLEAHNYICRRDPIAQAEYNQYWWEQHSKALW